MRTVIRHIRLDRLVPHPDNPNRMSRANFQKLVRNIERAGRYEPLIVRPCPARRGFFQILNGHHRCEALRQLGRTTAEAVVWKIDDEQTDIFLATLNRLTGRDILEKKLTLLRRLSGRIPLRKLARLLPQTLGQIERLTAAPPLVRSIPKKATAVAVPMVFFVEDGQQQRIEEALSAAGTSSDGRTRAARRAAALTQMAVQFLGRGGCEGPSSPRS